MATDYNLYDAEDDIKDVDSDDEFSMILVMGMTGAGKSYFVNQLAPDAVVEQPGMKSETKDCLAVRLRIGDEYVAVVDTPGFDDTYRGEDEILATIAEYLVVQYDLGIPLKGIIYLHRITDNRMQGSALKYFRMFEKLCGEAAFPNIVLVTTMWSQLSDRGIGLNRDMELRKDFWNFMIQKRSTVSQFDGSHQMARGIVEKLLLKKDIVLNIQRELISQGKTLEETAAGAILAPELDERIRDKEGTITHIEHQIESASANGQWKVVKQLQANKSDALTKRDQEVARRGKLQKKIHKDVKAKIDRERRLRKWKDGVALFGAVLGLGVTLVVNLVLPLCGVVI